jgi:hypothetical protein
MGRRSGSGGIHGWGCPLNLSYPNLFEICNQREWTVAKVLRDERINMTFRRNFGDKEEREWDELTLLTYGVSLSHESDSVIWTLEKNKEFQHPLYIKH